MQMRIKEAALRNLAFTGRPRRYWRQLQARNQQLGAYGAVQHAVLQPSNSAAATTSNTCQPSAGLLQDLQGHVSTLRGLQGKEATSGGLCLAAAAALQGYCTFKLAHMSEVTGVLWVLTEAAQATGAATQDITRHEDIAYLYQVGPAVHIVLPSLVHPIDARCWLSSAGM
jgi:hypothetical protein